MSWLGHEFYPGHITSGQSSDQNFPIGVAGGGGAAAIGQLQLTQAELMLRKQAEQQQAAYMNAQLYRLQELGVSEKRPENRAKVSEFSTAREYLQRRMDNWLSGVKLP